jgi:drug/metabolite transporter (DMT)-like permease
MLSRSVARSAISQMLRAACALLPAGAVVSRITKASVIAPFHYLQIIFAVFYGYLVFNNLPDLLTIAGSVVISLAGIAICWLEIRASKPDRA